MDFKAGPLEQPKFRFIGIAAALALAVCAFALQMGAAFGAEPAPAEGIAPGTYILAAHPYYAHPVTGVMEDSGQNPGIGQGMTESVLGKEALLEVYGDGSMYVTVRFALMDNIQDIRLSVQEDAEADYVPVGFETVKEDVAGEGVDAKADLRFAAPSVSAIVRAEFFVTAMGRDVIFFMDFSDPVPGSGDFVTTDEAPAGGGEDVADAGAAGASGDAGAGGADGAQAKPEDGFAGGTLDTRTFALIAAAVVVVAVVCALLLRARKKKQGC